MEVLKSETTREMSDDSFKANITTLASILSTPNSEMTELIACNLKSNELITKESSLVSLKNKLKTAKEIPEPCRLSTGCVTIDSIIRGGFYLGGINEIVGCSGVGKTQICLQLAIISQLPKTVGGLEKDVLYICTEDVFPSKRLHELANEFAGKFNVSFEDNVLIYQADNSEQLHRCLKDLEKLLTVKHIGLIIIDSIAGLFRSENADVNYLNRSQEFVSIATKLHKIASDNNLAVVCVNQVTDDLNKGTTEPCLGLTWSNLVTCRFNIKRYIQSEIREFEVVFGPDLPSKCCKFKIGKEGLISWN